MARVPTEDGHVRAISDRAAYKRRLRLGNIKLFENPDTAVLNPLVSVEGQSEDLAHVRYG